MKTEKILFVALLTGCIAIAGALGIHDYIDSREVSVTVAEVNAIEHETPSIEPVEVLEVQEPYYPIEFQVDGMFNDEYSMQDLYEAAATVYVESGNLSSECQRAVASVIVNRVHSSSFPNTVHGVIRQNGQYEGSIKGTVNKYISIFEDNQIVSDSDFDIYERCLENTMYVFEMGSTLDEDYVYQSMQRLGRDNIKIDTEYFGRE